MFYGTNYEIKAKLDTVKKHKEMNKTLAKPIKIRPESNLILVRHFQKVPLID